MSGEAVSDDPVSSDPVSGAQELELASWRREVGELYAAVRAEWWLRQYAGGLFLPVRDGTAGRSSYGGGRYALDTAKGADLGGPHGDLVIDPQLLYHPSCPHSDAWQCAP